MNGKRRGSYSFESLSLTTLVAGAVYLGLILFAVSALL